MKKRASLLVCFIVIALALVAQIKPAVPRKILIGGDFNYPPYEFLNDQGIPDGYNVELSKAITKQLNIQCEFRLAKWALVRQWLDSGQIDLIQGMAFSIERAKNMYFSEAHTQTWRSIFVRKNSRIKESKDILNATIVLQQDDIANEYLKRISFKGVIVEVPTQEDALKLLDSGEYDACIVNHMNGMYFMEQENLKHIKALPERILQKEYCYASKDPAMVDDINKALLILSQNGQLALIQNRWFNDFDVRYDQRITLQTLLPYCVPLIVALLALIIAVFLLQKAYRRTKQELAGELKSRESTELELQREYSIFVRGPVIIYKMQINPLKPLMISENVDQWGYSTEEILEMGEDYSGLIFSEDREIFLHQWSDPKQPDFSIKRYRVITKSKEVRWVLDYSTKVDTSRAKHLSYGYIMDITSQKNLEAQLMESKEKAEASSLAKSHFVANMSHEIRTPLNGIMGFLQVLMQMDKNTERSEYYDIMYSSGRSLMKIINDILDFSKIESGKLDLIRSEFNPRQLIDGILKTFVLQNKKPELEIRCNLNERIPNVLYGDQLRLKQVLINLLQNAMKFTDRGFVEIAADIYTISDTDIRLLFSVTDTGIGIDPRKQEDIFDNFSQADSLITSRYGGTGLGLSIVKRLVELMSGFIWVESEQDKGSSFFFILPFEIHCQAIQPIGDEPRQSNQMLPPLKGMKVLLVEDEPINQVVTKRQLENWNITVSLAANGQTALDLCKQNRFDAILMDIQMPVMDGITATQTLRLSEIQKGLHTPIIAFTAAALVGDRERFLECGMDDYIAKPVDMAELHSILAKYAPKN